MQSLEALSRSLLKTEDCCARPTENPSLGRACDRISPGFRRIELGRSVIFYRHHADGLVVVRGSHQEMHPDRHRLGDA